MGVGSDLGYPKILLFYLSILYLGWHICCDCVFCICCGVFVFVVMYLVFVMVYFIFVVVYF